jgi:hypothetical protein
MYVICRNVYNLSSYKILYPNSSGSLVIAVKWKPKLKFCSQSRCCCFTFYKMIALTKIACFLKICCYTSFQNPLLSVTPTSHVHASATLLLLIVGLQVCGWGDIQWYNVHTKCFKISKLVQKLNTLTTRWSHKPPWLKFYPCKKKLKFISSSDEVILNTKLLHYFSLWKMLIGKIQRPCFSPVFHLLCY